jgi:hypothetical protein
MNTASTSPEGERRAGIVKMSLALVQQLFGNEVKVERAGVTDDDLASGTISLIVSGHPDLPVVEEGRALERVQCVMQKHEDGTVTVQTFHRY